MCKSRYDDEILHEIPVSLSLCLSDQSFFFFGLFACLSFLLGVGWGGGGSWWRRSVFLPWNYTIQSMLSTVASCRIIQNVSTACFQLISEALVLYIIRLHNLCAASNFLKLWSLFFRYNSAVMKDCIRLD